MDVLPKAFHLGWIDENVDLNNSINPYMPRHQVENHNQKRLYQIRLENEIRKRVDILKKQRLNEELYSELKTIAWNETKQTLE